MKFDIGAIFGQIVSLYTRLPLAQKIALPFLFAASMGVIIFVSRWAGRPDYQVLFSGLSEADAAGIVEKLKDMKIGYRLQDDGKTVEVTPPEMVHELRLEMASSGLPKGGTIGYEIFDQSTLGQTLGVESIKKLRGKQGELERTIQSIDAVRSVRVHITEPERSSFVKRDIPPTASVVLRLKAGTELTPQQVKGITHLVAHSVERLAPENVSVIDSHGNLLNEKKDSLDLNGADLTRIDYQRRLEQSYIKQIETMLTGVLGPGKAIARVTADLDFSTFAKEEESYDPGAKVTRSERSIEEAAGLTAEGGVPGVMSNLTNDPGVLTPTDSTKNANKRIESVKNYEVSRAVSRTNSAPGKLQRLSVAVLVDGQYTPIPGTEKEGLPQKQYKPLPPEMVQKIDNLVKQAVGFDAARGDVVTVENMRFFEPDESLEKVLAKGETMDNVMKLLPNGLVLLVIILFFVIIARPLMKFLLSPTEAEVDLSRLLPAGVEELEAELEAERMKVSAMPEMQAPVIDIEELEQLLSENSRLVKENPQQAALLIRYWLNDGRV